MDNKFSSVLTYKTKVHLNALFSSKKCNTKLTSNDDFLPDI